MATTITLQAYLDDLNTMLENESPTEVISHCRYILQHYPQNVATYHLLGKALLQKGHNEGLKEYFDEAAEVFQRVLSVLPNDTTSNIGLSEIREQEKKTDQAIWHLERAYEQMPGNGMLQEALRKLYVKRDGEDRAPSKIQLTRAALARQYANGQLYDQALVELRAALEQSPNRIDLQVLLAETLWAANHPLEAAEVAIQVLKQLPNCLAANRILAQLWLGYQRPTDAQIFLDKLEALDPYEASRLIQPNTRVRDTHLLPRLDYTARAAASLTSETPDWVQDLGDVGSMEDVFRSAPQTPAADVTPSRRPAQIDVDSLFAEPPAATTPPDWMKDLEASSGGPEMPDWYGGSGQDLRSTELAQPERSLPIGADWLGEPTSSEMAQPPSAPEMPDWFAEVVQSAPAPASADQGPIQAEWLPPAETTGDDEFFAAFDQEPEAEAAGLDFAPPERPASGFTDLLQGIEESRASASLEPGLEAAEPMPPDWLAAFEAGDAVPPEAATEESAASAEPQLGSGEMKQFAVEPPEWQQPVTDMEEESLSGAELVIETGEPLGEADFLAEQGDPMAWMQSLDLSGETLPVEPEEPSDGILTELEALRQASRLPADADLSEFTFDDVDTGESPGLAPGGEMPAWMTEPENDFFAPVLDLEQPASPPQPEQASAVSDDWLAEFGAVSEPEHMETAEALDQPYNEEPAFLSTEPGAASQPSAGPAATDDWLTDLGALGDTAEAAELAGEILERAQETVPETPSSEPAEMHGPPEETSTEVEEPWLADLRDLGSAEAYEELAAAEIPEWLQEARPDTPVQEPAELHPLVEELGVGPQDWLADFEGFADAGSMETPGEIAPGAPETLPVEPSLDMVPESAVSAAIEPPAFDDELMALFEVPQADALFAAPQQPLAEVEEPAQTEQPEPHSLEWAQSGSPDDDWLQSFAKVESSEPALDVSGELSAPPSPPDVEAVASDWLSEVPGLDDTFGLQTIGEEAFTDLGQELSLDWEGQTASTQEEAPTATEEPPAAGIAEPEDLWAAVSAIEVPPEADAGPAWLADVEPVGPASPILEDQGEREDEAYDAFAAGRTDHAAYQSAADTGILQPGEEPDWMRAFAGEEMPLELGEQLPVEQGEPEDVLVAGTEPGELALDWSGLEAVEAETLDEVEPLPSADQAAAGYTESGELEYEELAPAGEPAGDMPDWLVAITDSERDKLDDQFLEELDTYSSAADTGVLQPGSTPDWLTQLGDQPQTTQDEPAAEMVIEGSKVAQPGDLAHTKDALTGSVETDLAEEELGEVPVPEDFALEDQVPAWLRRPKETDPSARPAGGPGRPAETPEWLRSIFEDDESTG